MTTPSPSAAMVMAPVRRSRTAPRRSGATQPKQMPIRQPDGMSTPAASPVSSRLSVPSFSTAVPSAVNVTVPPSPVAMTVGRNRSVCRRSARPALAQWRSRVSSRPTGPQAQVWRSETSATRSRSEVTSSMPSVSVWISTSWIRPRAASLRSSPPKITSAAVGAECTTTTSAAAAAGRFRTIPITGVMPLPAVTNRTLAGAGLSRVNSPAA